MANIETTLRKLSNENTAKTFAFNSAEAEKSREFSKEMSDTSHQREVEDLKKAGLNPVLSANSGASAYSASSASATADNSAVGLLASIYQTKLNNQNAVKIARINANTDLQMAKINAAASKYASDNSSSASRYSTDRSKFGLIDNFVNGVIGNNSRNSTSARYIGKKTNGIIGSLAKLFK